MYDVFIVGGGVNGVGIARDAAGRGLSVGLCEQSDLAQATSSASTKLFHGGLRYLEYYEFRLVRQALIEREVLLHAMPHIAWPMRFVLPHHKGLRPRWLVRLGLFIYDHIGGRKNLPATKSLDLSSDVAGVALKDDYTRGYEYSDCWVEDSRLVALNARDAADRGADIMPRTKMVSAERRGDVWKITLSDHETGAARVVDAKAIVNAGGPWVEDIIRNGVRMNTSDKIRLVRGSHIVTKKLFTHNKPYIFQQSDGRIVFAIPYETDYTLIGTTDAEHEGDPSTAVCTPEESDYLLNAVSEYFKKPVTQEDIVWTYAGVRPLYDDGASSATAATRDYVLKLEDENGQPPLLNIFGGKITTYRRLAEKAVEMLRPHFDEMDPNWTAGIPLPGGDFPVDGVKTLVSIIQGGFPFIDMEWALRLVRAYGTDAPKMLGDARSVDDLGLHFGWTLYEREVKWLMDREWARTAEDVLYRRSKIGLRVSEDEAAALDAWMQSARSAAVSAAE